MANGDRSWGEHRGDGYNGQTYYQAMRNWLAEKGYSGGVDDFMNDFSPENKGRWKELTTNSPFDYMYGDRTDDGGFNYLADGDRGFNGFDDWWDYYTSGEAYKDTGTIADNVSKVNYDNWGQSGANTNLNKSIYKNLGHNASMLQGWKDEWLDKNKDNDMAKMAMINPAQADPNDNMPKEVFLDPKYYDDLKRYSTAQLVGGAMVDNKDAYNLANQGAQSKNIIMEATNSPYRLLDNELKNYIYDQYGYKAGQVSPSQEAYVGLPEMVGPSGVEAQNVESPIKSDYFEGKGKDHYKQVEASDLISPTFIYADTNGDIDMRGDSDAADRLRTAATVNDETGSGTVPAYLDHPGVFYNDPTNNTPMESRLLYDVYARDQENPLLQYVASDIYDKYLNPAREAEKKSVEEADQKEEEKENKKTSNQLSVSKLSDDLQTMYSTPSATPKGDNSAQGVVPSGNNKTSQTSSKEENGPTTTTNSTIKMPKLTRDIIEADPRWPSYEAYVKAVQEGRAE